MNLHETKEMLITKIKSCPQSRHADPDVRRLPAEDYRGIQESLIVIVSMMDDDREFVLEGEEKIHVVDVNLILRSFDPIELEECK